MCVALLPRDASMLAWRVVEGPTTRARIAVMLWPAGAERQARTALRQRLWQLQKSLGLALVGQGPVLALDVGVSHDLAQPGELLGTVRLAGAHEFDGWLHGRCDQRRACCRERVQALARELEDAGDPGAALLHALQLRDLEPLSEVAHQWVMRLLYLAGDRAAALAAFDYCEQLLKNERVPACRGPPSTCWRPLTARCRARCQSSVWPCPRRCNARRAWWAATPKG